MSGYVGLRKPHRDIYDYALKQFGIDASGALFVDDKAMNIVGANEAAFAAYGSRMPARCAPC